jgi:hypothetical protein
MSTLLDTKILEKNSIGFHNLSVPTTSGGTTYSKGNSGQILKSNGDTIYWSNPVDKALPTRQLEGYYNPDDEFYAWNVVSTAANTYTTNLTLYTIGYGYLFLDGSPGSNVGKYHSSLPLDPANNSVPYEFTVGAGQTLTMNITLTNPSGLMHNGSKIYSCSRNGGFSASVILSDFSDPEDALAGDNLLSREISGMLQPTSLILPFVTSETGNAIDLGNQYSYTNNTRRSQTVYLHIILKVQNSYIYNIRKTSGGTVQTSGTLTYVLKPDLSYSISGEDNTFPLGYPYCNYATDGYVIIRSEDSITAMLPETFFVKRGDFCYKIDSSGIKKSTNGGVVWK